MSYRHLAFTVAMALSLAAGASALAQPAPAPESAALETCVAPAPPRYPRADRPLTLEQLDWTHEQRDRFLAESTPYLACLDREIEARLRRVSQTNVNDPRLLAAGREHEAASAAHGDAIKRFALLCYAYEGRTGLSYAPGCLPTSSR